MCTKKLISPATVGFTLSSLRSLRKAFILLKIVRYPILKKGAPHLYYQIFSLYSFIVSVSKSKIEKS